MQRTGKANKALCDVVIEQLQTALGSSRTDPRRILESGYNLGVDGLYLALDRVSCCLFFVGFFYNDYETSYTTYMFINYSRCH